MTVTNATLVTGMGESPITETPAPGCTGVIGHGGRHPIPGATTTETTGTTVRVTCCLVFACLKKKI